MSNSVIEQFRLLNEEIETIEKAVSISLHDKKRNTRKMPKVFYDQVGACLIKEATTKGRQIQSILRDEGNVKKDELLFLTGQNIQPADPNALWKNFYRRIKEVKEYHKKLKRLPNNESEAESRSAYFYLDETYRYKAVTLFSAEEDFGRRLDLNEIFFFYQNMKKLKQSKILTHQEETALRLKRQFGDDVKLDDPKFAEKFVFVDMDYVSWLRTFADFSSIPRHCKYGDAVYEEYLMRLCIYLTDFFVRSHPYANLSRFFDQVDAEFDEAFHKKHSIPEWRRFTCELDSQYSPVSDMIFANEACLKSHVSGQKFQKFQKKFDALSEEEKNEKIENSKKIDEKLAKLEFYIKKIAAMLTTQVQATIHHIQKKQSQDFYSSNNDWEEEGEEAEEGEKPLGKKKYYDPNEDIDFDLLDEQDQDEPVYNPLNLPLGWNGKPIPYWLYRLNGLGFEFKCEICGNYSYWGRLNFEKHFQEWRHAYGMSCLRIPNTSHFKEITKIEDALALFEKLKKDKDAIAYQPDEEEEFEDAAGNIMSRQTIQDLWRQGLL